MSVLSVCDRCARTYPAESGQSCPHCVPVRVLAGKQAPAAFAMPPARIIAVVAWSLAIVWILLAVVLPALASVIDNTPGTVSATPLLVHAVTALGLAFAVERLTALFAQR